MQDWGWEWLLEVEEREGGRAALLQGQRTQGQAARCGSQPRRRAPYASCHSIQEWLVCNGRPATRHAGPSQRKPRTLCSSAKRLSAGTSCSRASRSRSSWSARGKQYWCSPLQHCTLSSSALRLPSQNAGRKCNRCCSCVPTACNSAPPLPAAHRSREAGRRRASR